MSLDDLRTAVDMCKGRAVTEASGRITPETAPAVAATGVDQIAVGWLTHSAKVLDIGLADEIYRPPVRTALAVPTDEGLVRLTIQKDGGIRLRNDSGGEMPATAFISLACAYRAREE